MKDNDSLIILIRSFKKWSKRIIIIGVIAGVIAAAISLILPNYYKAVTVFLPANMALTTPTPVGMGEKDRFPFGSGNDLDRLFVIASSQSFRKHIIEKFDLAKHYDVDTSSYDDKLRVFIKFDKLFSVEKNKYEAVELSYEDVDRELSAEIANYSRDYLGKTSLDLVRGTNDKFLSTFTTSLSQQELLANTLSDSIIRIKSRSNIVQSGTQGAELAERLVEAQADYEDASAKASFYSNKPAYRDSLIKYQAASASSQNRIRGLSVQSSKYSNNVNELVKIESELNQVISQISIDKERLKQLKSVQDSEMTSLHIIESASVPLKKSRPKRVILVLTSMIITALVALLLSIVLESEFYTKLKSEL